MIFYLAHGTQRKSISSRFGSYALFLLISIPLLTISLSKIADERARILVEFLEVAITSIVFLKGVYPSGAFERRRYMNVVVQRARHPQLRDYIHSAVTGLLPFIQKVGFFFSTCAILLFNSVG